MPSCLDNDRADSGCQTTIQKAMRRPPAETHLQIVRPRWTTAFLVLLALTDHCAGVATIPVVIAEAGQKRSAEDALLSIEGKLNALDSFAQVLRLSGVQSCLEHLERRMDSLEATVSRMDDRLERLYEAMMARDRSGVDLERKMDITADKIIAHVSLLGARSTVPMDDVVKKMDRMERNLGELLDDVLVKMLKAEEKRVQMEVQWTSQVDRLERIATEVREGLKEERTRGDDSWTVVTNATVAVDEGTKALQTQAAKMDATSSTQQAAADTPLTTDSESYWRNVSTTLDDALLVGQKKFHELDGDIEMYTRKVLNAYQELLKESKGIEDYLNKVIDHDNQTRSVVKEGFRKLFHQMKPLSSLEEIIQSLRKKVAEMGSTVDTSFASLLVAQNTFIATCHRIQHQEPQIETKIYHLLQKLMAQVEERSGRNNSPETNDTSLLKAFEAHRQDVGRAMHDLVWTVITVGNQTALDLQRAMEQIQLWSTRRCPSDDKRDTKDAIGSKSDHPSMENSGRDVESATTDWNVGNHSITVSPSHGTEVTDGSP